MKKEKLGLFESEITRILKKALDGPFTIKFFLRRSTMSVKSLISTILLVLLCTATVSAYTMQDAVGEYYIPIGIPVIDGVISPNEWDKALWLDLDEVYYGDPLDLSNAKWAAMWSPDTNLIYVAVTGTDTVHIFGDSYGELAWNKYDLMEVYVDVGNSDIQVYYVDGNTVREPAHQWMCGNDNNDGSWVVLPEENEHPDNNLPEEIRPTLVTSIDGNVLTYELAIPPYEWIGWLTDNTMNLMELETDMRIGLDVIMSSKSSTKFGMLCEHFWSTGDDIDGDGSADGVDTSQKWKFAERYLDHSLVADPNQAWRPRPHNNTTDVVPNTITLKWNAGKNAAAHDVYFGTDQANVNDANTANTALYPGVFRGNQLDVNEPNYTPPEIPLMLGTTYYWRIDEVNGLTTVKGGTGSEIFLETSITRDGNSMKCLYDNGSAPYYSQADANIADLENVLSDWAALGVKALSLWFYGKAQNSITTNDKMYIALKDTSNNFAVVPYSGDANNLKLAVWQEWFIELQDFNDINNVDLSSIASIHIGFGNRHAPAAGGAGGTVYFDDIQVSLPYCVPSEAEGDATGDCFVDYDDLRVLAGDWVETDFTVPVAAPANELIWYKFDNEIQNNRAKDSSGNGYNGIITGQDWTTEGYIDGALNFDGNTTQVSVPLPALTSITTQVTIALWQYGNPAIQPKNDNLFEGTRAYSNTPGVRVLNAHLPWGDDERVIWCAGNPNAVYDPNVWRDCERIEKVAVPEEYEGKWNHWTFIKDCDANGGTGELKMYLNGFLWHSGYDANVPITGTIDKVFLIGNGFDGYYAGVMDDFRIYNYALNQEEISYLATAGTGYYPLQDRQANAYEDESIDFRDFAVMGDNWLKELLWPQ
jgi:hypothetical protein